MLRALRLATCLFVALAGTAGASQRLTLFDLQLGGSAAHMPDAFRSYACGTDGGPPGEAVADWTDFPRCAPDADGLHEIYFEYDGAAEMRARREGNPAATWGLGTSIDYFPIVASALFDDGGTLQGLRIVTDPRPEQRKDPFLLVRPYGEHYLLQLYLMDRFGMSAGDCKDIPLAAGRAPVFGMVTNRVCDRTDLVGKRHYHVEARFFRRRGQHDVDPDTGRPTEGQFVSETRAEIRAIGG